MTYIKGIKVVKRGNLYELKNSRGQVVSGYFKTRAQAKRGLIAYRTGKPVFKKRSKGR